MTDVIDILTRLFSHVCHQNPDRSFSLLVFGGKSILCARCSGMYLGLICGVSFLLIRKISELTIIKMILCSVVLLLVEMIGENLNPFLFGNTTRALTGVFFGISVGMGLISPLIRIIRSRK